MKKFSVKSLVATALLWALLIGVQQFRGISQFITGPLVNAILIVAAIWVGKYSGLAIAFLSPLFALLIMPGPLMQALPMLVPIIGLGNAALVMCAYFFKKKSLPVFGAGLLLGSVLKALILWVGVVFFVFPIFGADVPPPMIAAGTAMFSWNQLITAAIGSAIVLIIYPVLNKALRTS